VPALEAFEKAKQVWATVGDQSKKSYCVYNMGVLSNGLGNYENAIKFHEEGLQIRLSIGDKEKISNSYCGLGNIYQNLSDYSAAEKYYLKSVEICKEINDKKGLSYAYGSLANNKVHEGDYNEALKYAVAAEKICLSSNDEDGLAAVYQILTTIYFSMVDYKKSIDYCFKSISIYEKRKNIGSLNNVKGNMGTIYRQLGEYDKAIIYLTEAKEYFKSKSRKMAVANFSSSLAGLYNLKNDFNKSLELYNEALDLYTEMKSINGVALCKIGIGGTYSSLGNDLKAIEHTTEALNLSIKSNSLRDVVNSEINLGLMYKGIKDYSNALKYLNLGVDDAKKNGMKDLERDAYKTLSDLHATLNKDAEALSYYKQFISLKDSLINQDNDKEIARKEMNYEFEKKEALAKLEFDNQQALSNIEIEKKQILIDKNNQSLLLLGRENELKELSLNKSQLELKHKKVESESQKKQVELLNKDNELKKVEAKQKEEALQKQRLITYGFAAGGLLVLGLLFFAIRGYIQKRKDNNVITEQKKEVEKQKDYAEQQHKIAEEQKHLVEEHQREIIDSINYAQRIQRSLLASTTLLNSNLQDYFILFKPKDIVSGDFYWASKLANGQFVLVTADSTGHGVPGAIMSMLNIASLNEAISKGVMRPDEILFETRNRIIEHLKNDGSEQGGKDGMDCSLLCFDFKNKILTCAAANNPLWIVRENELIELKPDKMPCGKHDKDKEPFTLHTVNLQKGDTVYALTDGFPDQFGGPKGKKFMSKSLKEVLTANVNLPMAEQKQILESTFKNWLGNLEQIDDVTIIGIKI